MTSDETADAAADRLTELERAMGILSVDHAAAGEHFDGEIEDEEPDEPPEGRAAVGYGDDTGLFDEDDATGLMIPNPESPAGCSDPESPSPVASDLLGGDLGSLLGGDPGALIAHLEQMAAALEAESGEEESEIRAKIALLRSVLDDRPSVVQQQLARIATAEDEDEDQATAAVVAESLQDIETSLGNVDSLLADNPEAVQLLAQTSHVWMQPPASQPAA